MAHQHPLSMGFPRQEYWNELPFSSPRDLLHPGIKPESPTLAGFFTTEPPGKTKQGITRTMGDSRIAQSVNHLPAMLETWIQFLSWEDPLEKEMATHSNILAWEIPWTEEPSGLQFMGSQQLDTT